MEQKDIPTFFIILMPRERISEIKISESLIEPIELLKRAGVEKKEFKKKALEKQIAFYTVKYNNKKYRLADIYEISSSGDEYLDYLKIEGTFINFPNSIDLLYTFMKDFGSHFFEWALMDYTNLGPLNITTKNKMHQYVYEFWQKREPQAVSSDNSTMLFKHPGDLITENHRIKPKWR